MTERLGAGLQNQFRRVRLSYPIPLPRNFGDEGLLGVKVISPVSQTEEYGFESRRRYFWIGNSAVRVVLLQGTGRRFESFSIHHFPKIPGEEDIPL